MYTPVYIKKWFIIEHPGTFFRLAGFFAILFILSLLSDSNFDIGTDSITFTAKIDRKMKWKTYFKLSLQQLLRQIYTDYFLHYFTQMPNLMWKVRLINIQNNFVILLTATPGMVWHFYDRSISYW